MAVAPPSCGIGVRCLNLSQARSPHPSSGSNPERQVGGLGVHMRQASLAPCQEGRDFQEHMTWFWRTGIIKGDGARGT